jgi:metal-responsive CopG/Arc/MetJ family transcriptional regulator
MVDSMSRKLISVRISEDRLKELDKLAGSNGFNRSRLIEAVLDLFLREEFLVQRAVLREAQGLLRGTLDDE